MLKNIKNSIIQLLSFKSASVTIVLIALCSRVVQLFFFFNIRVDGMYQYLAMKYFVAGHGVSIAEVLAENLSVPVYELLINWPPGYSILLSPLYVLFNDNYVAAGLTLDILAATALIIFSRKILRLLEIPVHLVNIYTLFSGLFIYNFYFIASSDAIAISLYVIAVHQTILLLKTKSKWFFRTGLISILLISCGLIKYLFYPVVFVIPVFLITKGLIHKLPLQKKAGYISLILITVALVSLLLYQKKISGAAGYISQPERGIFPENLSFAYPFIPGSIINPESITKAISRLKTAESLIFSTFQLIHIFSIVAIFICIILWVRKKGFRNFTLINSFYTISILISFVIVALLTILSLTVAKEEINPGVMWSYIEDARYHGLITVLFQICLFIIIHQLIISDNKKWRFILILIPLFLLPETFRGLFFDANRIHKINTEEYSWQQELSIQKYADAIIAGKRRSIPFTHTAVTGTSYYVNYRVCIFSDAFYLKNTKAIYEEQGLKSAENVLLLYIIETNKVESQKSSIEKGRFDYEGSLKGYNFYSKLINKTK